MALQTAVMELVQLKELVAGKIMLLLLRDVVGVGITGRVPELLRSVSAARVRIRIGL